MHAVQYAVQRRLIIVAVEAVVKTFANGTHGNRGRDLALEQRSAPEYCFRCTRLRQCQHGDGLVDPLDGVALIEQFSCQDAAATTQISDPATGQSRSFKS